MRSSLRSDLPLSRPVGVIVDVDLTQFPLDRHTDEVGDADRTQMSASCGVGALCLLGSAQCAVRNPKPEVRHRIVIDFARTAPGAVAGGRLFEERQAFGDAAVVDQPLSEGAAPQEIADR